MRLIFCASLIFCVCLSCLVFQISGRKCGRPVKPLNSDVQPLKDVYNEGEEVIYTCKKGYYTMIYPEHLVKETQRNCICNGTWSGTTAQCNYYDYLHDNPNNTYYSKTIFDDKNETCSDFKFPKSSNQITITFNINSQMPGTVYTLAKLGQMSNFVFNNDWVYMFPFLGTGVPVNMSVAFLNNNIRIYNGVEKPMSSYSPVTFKSELSTTDKIPQKMSITFLAMKINDEVEISLCSLKAIMLKGRNCGLPDDLLNGYHEKDGSETSYFCNAGYYLQGFNKSICKWNRKIGGFVWLSKQPPVCVSENEKKCRDTQTDQSERVIFLDPSCPQDSSFVNHSDIALLRSAEGLNSNRTIYCNEATNWTWSLDASRVVSIQNAFYGRKHDDKNYIAIIAITIGSLLTVCCATYFIYRYCTNKRLIPTPQNKEPEHILDQTFILGESEPSLSTANSRNFTNPSLANDSAIYGEGDIYASISPSGSVHHCFQNDEPCVSIVKNPTKCTPYKDSSSVTDATNLDCLYATVNSPDDTPTKNPHTCIKHYLQSDEPYATIAKVARPVKKCVNIAHEYDDRYASLKHRNLQASNTTVPVEYYSENGEIYAQVNKTGKKNISDSTKARISTDLYEPLYNNVKDDL